MQLLSARYTWMLRYSQQFFRSMVTSIDHAPISSDDRTRLQHYSVFLLAGIPTMVVFGLYNLAIANYLLVALVLLSAAGLIVGWLFLRHLKDGRFVYRINAVLFGLLISYMVLIGGEGGSKILWMYTFPLISFFLFGKKEGLGWSVGAIVVAVLLMWNPLDPRIAYAYPAAFVTRFVTTYVIVAAVTYWFEHFRHSYRIDV